MLFSIKNNKIKSIKENDFKLEKEIQILLEQNLEDLFNLKFVASEFAISNFRIDTLAFDKESNAFIIIEYKKGRNESLIDQGYTYLNILLDRKADFVLKYNEMFNTNIKINDIEWEGSRVIFISPKFTDYQIKANDFKNNPIDLIQITRYENDIIEIDKIKKNTNVKLVIQSKDDENMVSKVDKQIKIYSEEDHLNGITENIIELYFNLKNKILEWDNVDIEAKKLYIAFKGKNNITDVVIQNKALKLFINLKKGELEDPKAFSRDITNIGHWGNGDYEVVISNDDYLEYVLSLIKQSWKKNKM